MKVSNPAMSGQASGSLAGLVFATQRGFNTIRVKVNPVRRIRTTQPANRARLGWLSRNWGYITEAKRELWRIWAASHKKTDVFGNLYSVTGINAYCELNIRRMQSQASTTPNDDPPVSDLDIGMASLAAVDGAGGGAITLNWTHLGTAIAGDKNEVGMSGPFTSPGVFDSAQNYAVQTFVAGNLLTAVMTGFVEEAWYWFRVRYVQSDGQASAYLYVQWQAPAGA